MPTIKTTGWAVADKAESRFIHLPSLRLPVFVRKFVSPNDGYTIVYPQGRISPDLWKIWVQGCQKYALFDVEQKFWVYPRLTLERLTSANEVSSVNTTAALTKVEREQLKAKRKEAEIEFQKNLDELSKHENVPEDLWTSYTYPPHYQLSPQIPLPTALQRIVVSRYWNRPFALIAASVGTGKSRMAVDILNSRAGASSLGLRDSARIILLVAPLALHENWRREFAKWSPPGAQWFCHKFAPNLEFWRETEKSASYLFDGESLKTGGLVIICTPNALSRAKLPEQFTQMGYVPTAIIVDEVQRFFRKPTNKAYKNLMEFRKRAHLFLGLSGTPTSKFEDWWALEELMSAGAPSSHWRDASYIDYQKLGDKSQFTSSGLFQKGWDYPRAIKEFHYDRIQKGHIFMADKFYYMKDALPGLGQEEIGDFADLRLTFNALMDEYPDWVTAAWELQKKESGGSTFAGGTHALATTIMLRMRQVAAMSHGNEVLLKEFVEDFLDPEEPAVFWVEFRNGCAEQLQKTVDFLNRYGPTSYVMGGMTEEMRQEGIDGFQSGKYRFIVCQVDAGGVGLTLTRACKCLFLTIPLGYQAVAQAIGRLHRIGQQNDVMSYFAMTSPIASFARRIYDNRAELNEHIPQQISGVFKQIVDTAKPATVTSVV